MRSSLLLLVAILTLSSFVKAGKNNCPNKISRYEKCLNQGFASNLGCDHGADKVMRDRRKQKCAKLEAAAERCGYSCFPPPINGEWGDFSDWTDCSVECGGGTHTRFRACDNPAPQYGGSDCEGSAKEEKLCNTDPCPVNGDWGEFGAWSDCSAECGGGEQTRTKSCNNPAPQNGGADCEGEATETRPCNKDPCDPGCWDKADRAHRGSGYAGAQTKTKSGETCQKWTDQSPHRHGYYPSRYPGKGLGDHNYCRNPSNKYHDTWCYTTNPDKRWDFCDVDTCDCKDKDDDTGAAYRGTVAVTKSGKKCQAWGAQSPNEHARTPENYPESGLEDNYCRNPDGESGAWCYNDEGTNPRWELCDIPTCA